MSKGFQKTNGKATQAASTQEGRNASQIQALTQMIFENSQALRHLQMQNDVLLSCIGMTEKQTAIEGGDFVLLNARVFTEDFSQELAECAIANHLLNTSHPRLYADGFVTSLLAQTAGTEVVTTCRFPDDHGTFPGQTQGFKVKILKVYKA